MLLSVIIPCYNYDHNLENLCQNLVVEFSEFAEIILVNDGSTDSTKEICEKLKSDFTCIQVFHQKNKGPAAARQLGTNNASGNWIYYIDADDQIIRGVGKKIYKSLSNKPKEALLIAGFISVLSNGKEKVKLPKKNFQSRSAWVRAFLNKKISIVNGGVLLKKAVFNKIKWDHRFTIVEDKIFYAHCLANFDVKTLNFPLCKVVHHSESLRQSADKAVEEIPKFVNALFEEGKLPKDIYKLKNAFHAKRHLSASRVFFIGQNKKRGRQEFYKALKVSPISVLNKSYLKKFLISFVKK
ncbi:MAG: glycosyltransferase family 2 protein [Lentisphaeraceae bacterium]|nr:glycosyltransferase family 2 protein [Lentisphaeraceae bacterium]